MAVCCPSVSITADLLNAYQDIPFGTPAHDKSYGRRNILADSLTARAPHD